MLVMSVLLYGAETWAVMQKDTRKLRRYVCVCVGSAHQLSLKRH